MINLSNLDFNQTLQLNPRNYVLSRSSEKFGVTDCDYDSLLKKLEDLPLSKEFLMSVVPYLTKKEWCIIADTWLWCLKNPHVILGGDIRADTMLESEKKLVEHLITRSKEISNFNNNSQEVPREKFTVYPALLLAGFCVNVFDWDVSEEGYDFWENVESIVYKRAKAAQFILKDSATGKLDRLVNSDVDLDPFAAFFG